MVFSERLKLNVSTNVTDYANPLFSSYRRYLVCRYVFIRDIFYRLDHGNRTQAIYPSIRHGLGVPKLKATKNVRFKKNIFVFVSLMTFHCRLKCKVSKYNCLNRLTLAAFSKSRFSAENEIYR